MTHRDPDLRAANLGLASTREMLQELSARGRTSRIAGEAPAKDYEHLEADADHLLQCLSPEVLDYKTVSK